ncbi:MAG TPA: ATP-binding protein [Cytophagaceae bacterium]|jgi:ATP-dependent DNA helicase RecG|nr:ATP-binding protein [Cytophagaceae bacterium]
MKKESQNIEYKESWRDEYLKWICGFANAQGGKIYIGINDKGQVVGTSDAKKLLEEIPNKVRDTLGIMVDVNLKRKSKEYIEIIVEPYPYPVSYKGQYHYRSGSTKQELKGQALDKFLLEKQGKRWDGVPVPTVKVSNLSKEAFAIFKDKATLSKRVSASILEDGNEQLLEDLHLKEGTYLKRAAILLFHPEPEKYISGAFIKIGFFASDDDLKFQDEIHGNLFHQIERTIELLFSRYIKSEISYSGVNRIETYEYPQAAIREALLNAIAHKDYSGQTPIQISVYEDKIMFWNEGQLPDKWTVENLKSKHPSKPFNPDIANALFRSGYIEMWGRGTINMVNECRKMQLPDPSFRYDASGFLVEFRKDFYVESILEEKGFSKHLIQILLYTKEHEAITNSEVQEICQVSKRTASRYLSELEGTHLIKTGATGKGTAYQLKGPQRGQNDLKGATKGPKEGQRGHNETKSLDEKLRLLEQELEIVDPNETAKLEFNENTLFSLLDTWLADLMKELIPVGQKFNHLFKEPRHRIFIVSGIGKVEFSGENVNKIIDQLKEDCKKNQGHHRYEASFELVFTYNKLLKGGIKPFMLTEQLIIEFKERSYKVLMDEGITNKQRVQQFEERLLHKALTKKEIKHLAEKLGESLYNQLDYYTTQNGIRNNKK